MGLGVGHQFLCSHVQYRETVFVDRPKLPVQTILDNLRERISIDFFRSLPADFIQLFFCAINERREYPFWNGAHLLHHIGNLLGIGDNHLIGFFFAKIGEFFQHFRCGAHIKWRLMIGVVEPLSSHQYFAVIPVFGV